MPRSVDAPFRSRFGLLAPGIAPVRWAGYRAAWLLVTAFTSVVSACGLPTQSLGHFDDRTIAIWAVVATVVAVVVAVLGIVGSAMQNRAQRRKTEQLAYYETFPFDYYTSANLFPLKQRLLGQLAGLPYTPRRPPELQSALEDRIDRGNILLTGRQGLGKTREAIESIERVARKTGDEITVLVPHDNCDVPFFPPADLPHRHIVVFIDDVHLHFPAAGDTSRPQTFLDRPFENRLSAVMDWLRSRFAGGTLRLIFTARDEPELKERRRPKALVWSEFDEYQLPYLHKDIRRGFIRAAADFYRLSLADVAVDHIADRSDGTCLGITTALAQFPANSIVKREDLLRLDFSFPQNWRNDVYRRQIETQRERRAVFLALAIIRRAYLRPRKELVLELAARIAGGVWPYTKSRIDRTIRNDLRAWMFEFEGEIICTNAYLDSVDIGDTWARHLHRAVQRLLRNSDIAPTLVGDLFNLTYAISAGTVAPADGAAIMEGARGIASVVSQ